MSRGKPIGKVGDLTRGPGKRLRAGALVGLVGLLMCHAIQAQETTETAGSALAQKKTLFKEAPAEVKKAAKLIADEMAQGQDLLWERDEAAELDIKERLARIQGLPEKARIEVYRNLRGKSAGVSGAFAREGGSWCLLLLEKDRHGGYLGLADDPERSALYKGISEGDLMEFVALHELGHCKVLDGSAKFNHPALSESENEALRKMMLSLFVPTWKAPNEKARFQFGEIYADVYGAAKHMQARGFSEESEKAVAALWADRLWVRSQKMGSGDARHIGDHATEWGLSCLMNQREKLAGLDEAGLMKALEECASRGLIRAMNQSKGFREEAKREMGLRELSEGIALWALEDLAQQAAEKRMAHLRSRLGATAPSLRTPLTELRKEMFSRKVPPGMRGFDLERSGVIDEALWEAHGAAKKVWEEQLLRSGMGALEASDALWMKEKDGKEAKARELAQKVAGHWKVALPIKKAQDDLGGEDAARRALDKALKDEMARQESELAQKRKQAKSKF